LPTNHCRSLDVATSILFIYQIQLQKTAHPKQLKATITVRQKKGKLIASATAAHAKYLLSPVATTLYRKKQDFVLRLPPQNKAHATFMQPLQCVLQHYITNPYISIYTWQQNVTTIV
jgi:hypothetical protein